MNMASSLEVLPGNTSKCFLLYQTTLFTMHCVSVRVTFKTSPCNSIDLTTKDSIY